MEQEKEAGESSVALSDFVREHHTHICISLFGLETRSVCQVTFHPTVDISVGHNSSE